MLSKVAGDTKKAVRFFFLPYPYWFNLIKVGTITASPTFERANASPYPKAIGKLSRRTDNHAITFASTICGTIESMRTFKLFPLKLSCIPPLTIKKPKDKLLTVEAQELG